MNLLRRHKVKLAAACLALGMASLLRAQHTICENTIGDRVDCQVHRGQPGMRITGVAVSFADIAIGVALILAAPAALLLIRRPD